MPSTLDYFQQGMQIGAGLGALGDARAARKKKQEIAQRRELLGGLGNPSVAGLGSQPSGGLGGQTYNMSGGMNPDPQQAKYAQLEQQLENDAWLQANDPNYSEFSKQRKESYQSPESVLNRTAGSINRLLSVQDTTQLAPAILQEAEAFRANGDIPSYRKALELSQLAQQNPELAKKQLMVMNDQIAQMVGGNQATLRGYEGDFSFKDEDGNIFIQSTFLDPNTQQTTTRLTDATGRDVQPSGRLTPVNKLGQTIGESIESDVLKTTKTEKAKAEIKLITEPEIERLVGLYRDKGKTEAADFDQLRSLETSLPALMDITNNLKELGSTATYSKSGRAYDAVSRELGFEPSEGATSRAKYIATVANEVLPLLKQTFGSAFTEKEGESLKATLGDPNLSPEEKNAQLDAFIESKTRQAESIRVKLGMPPLNFQGTQTAPVTSGKYQIEVVQ